MRSSFKYAINGLLEAVRSERNLRIHLSAAFYVLLAAAVTGASRAELCVVLLCIGAVIAAELVNTALEKLCDCVIREYSRDIGFVKDVSAGAVLVLAIASAMAGIVIFINTDKLSAAADFIKNNTVFSILILATVPIAVFLVFRSYKNGK